MCHCDRVNSHMAFLSSVAAAAALCTLLPRPAYLFALCQKATLLMQIFWLKQVSLIKQNWVKLNGRSNAKRQSVSYLVCGQRRKLHAHISCVPALDPATNALWSGVFLWPRHDAWTHFLRLHFSLSFSFFLSIHYFWADHTSVWLSVCLFTFVRRPAWQLNAIPSPLSLCRVLPIRSCG